MKKKLKKNKIKVVELANFLNISNALIIKKLIELGKISSINETLEQDVLELLALDFNFELATTNEIVLEKDMKEKPPVVTIMGHVDHGKTTLLDKIRNQNVASQEKGGITQNMKGYQIKVKKKKITFIDTPGHEAFFHMRKRGIAMADIVLLIVAADDGVQPQTIEALNYAKQAQTDIIVVVNKIDKNKNIDHIKNELSKYDLIPEEWGGKTSYVLISALKNEGIDNLIDNILLLAEVKELKADFKNKAQGIVLEATLDKKQGIVLDLLLKKGSLKQGDFLIIDKYYSKIRTIKNDQNQLLKEACPGDIVQVTGFSDMISNGTWFQSASSIKEAKNITKEFVYNKQKTKNDNKKSQTLDDFFAQENIIQKNIILKVDNFGSLEVIEAMINNLNDDKFQINIVKKEIGIVNANDLFLAKSFQAQIIVFNVDINDDFLITAKRDNIKISYFDVIYHLTEQLQKEKKASEKKEYENKNTGTLEIIKVFSSSKIGNIAGCIVKNGFIQKDSLVKIYRHQDMIFEGKITSLKKENDFVKKITKGNDCGLIFDNFQNFQIGDTVEAFVLEEIKN